MTRDKVRQVVFAALDEINELQPHDKQVPKDMDTILTGDHAVLSSLGLVNLLAAIEERLEDELGVSLSILGGDGAGGDDRRLQTVDALIAYVSTEVEELLRGDSAQT